MGNPARGKTNNNNDDTRKDQCEAAEQVSAHKHQSSYLPSHRLTQPDTEHSSEGEPPKELTLIYLFRSARR